MRAPSLVTVSEPARRDDPDEDRLTFRLGGRLRFRVRGRLRFPARSAPSGGFPCTRAVFRGDCAADIYTSASKCSRSRPLTCDPWRALIVRSLRAVRPVPRAAPLGRGALAAGCALHCPVAERGAVPSADRVVAGRRCLSSPASTPGRCHGAIAARGCTVRPSLSRRSVGRCCNGPAPRRPGGAR